MRESLEGSKQPSFSLPLSLSLSLSHTHTDRKMRILAFFKGFFINFLQIPHTSSSLTARYQLKHATANYVNILHFAKVFHTSTCTMLESLSVRHHGDIRLQSDAILSLPNSVYTFAPIHPLRLQSLRS